MKLTDSEKVNLVHEFQKAMDAGIVEKEDAVGVLEILANAARRRQEEMEKEYPWLKVCDIVQ